MHSGAPDLWTVKCQAPLVLVVHGRPLASFRQEQKGDPGCSYLLIPELSSWPRIKALVHFWPEHRPYWEDLIQRDKHVVFDYPPIDQERFSPIGPVHIPGCDWGSGIIDTSKRGEWNGLICDSWRDDVDIFEAACGALAAAKVVPGLKWHFYGMEPGKDGKLRLCWEFLLSKFREIGALGEVFGRMAGMDSVYRGMDFLLTPHRIITRCIGEALTIGLPVIAQSGCKLANRIADIYSPEDVAYAVYDLVKEMKVDREAPKAEALRYSAHLDLKSFGAKMSNLYSSILAGRRPSLLSCPQEELSSDHC